MGRCPGTPRAPEQSALIDQPDRRQARELGMTIPPPYEPDPFPPEPGPVTPPAPIPAPGPAPTPGPFPMPGPLPIPDPGPVPPRPDPTRF